jgi:hypothetical protein
MIGSERPTFFAYVDAMTKSLVNILAATSFELTTS